LYASSKNAESLGKEFKLILVELLLQQRELFVEEELLPGFSKMIARKNESLQRRRRGSYDVNIQVALRWCSTLLLVGRAT
jgi:hypothetical protein